MTETKKKRRLKEITLYEVVQNDKYELPIFARTLEEVMAFTGRTKVSILSAISHENVASHGKKRYENRFHVVRAGKVDSKDIF